MSGLKGFGIGGKFAVLVSALVVLSTSLVGFGTYRRFHESLVQKELTELRNEVHVVREQVASTVALLREDVSLLAHAGAVRDVFESAAGEGARMRTVAFREEARVLCQTLLAVKGQYSRIRFVTAQGRELMRAERNGKGIRLGEQDPAAPLLDVSRFRAPSSRTPDAVADPVAATVVRRHSEGDSGLSVVSAAAPVPVDHAVETGVVILEMDLVAYLRGLGEVNAARHTLYVVDRAGGILFTTANHDRRTGHATGAGSGMPEVLRGCDWNALTSQAVLQWDEERFAVGFEPLVLDAGRPKESIGFVTVAGHDEVVAGSIAARNQCVLFGGVSLVAALAIGLLFARSLTRPLRQIVGAVEAFGQGSRETGLPLEAADEPGMLARAFHDMMGQVRQRDDRRFRQLVETAPDAVIVVDSTGKIVLCNETAANVFRYTREELMELPLESLIPPDYREAHRKHFGRYISAPCVRPMMFGSELSGIRKDGEEFPAEISLSPLETEDGTLVLAAVRDISQRKKTEHTLRDIEAQLRQSQKLEAVGSLAGGVAHEFNNLLQAIQGYAKYAMEGLPEEERRYQDLVQVEKAAKRAATLTRQLLGFGRRQVMQRVGVDVNEMVGDLQRMLRPLIGEHIEVSFKLSRNAGHVHGDPAMLQQVLLNLCVNARDAMPGGGRLEITTESVKASDGEGRITCALQTGNYVRLTVADSGIGMAPEVKDHIFEPFFTTKEVGQGTGLGLAMVYGIVKEHHGEVLVESEPGQGTVFELYLPRTEGETAPDDPAVSHAVRSGNETVLLAEDEKMVREFSVRVLEEAGYTTLTARDGREAVSVFEENAPRVAVVILDVVMPHLSGWEVREQIRSKRPDVPVVLCTGYDPKTAQTDQAVDEDVQLLQKPFDRETLLAAVRDALDAKGPVHLEGATV